MTPHTHHREDDDWIRRGASLLMRWRGTAVLVNYIAGALFAILVMAWKFGPKLDAVMRRTTVLELNSQLRDSLAQRSDRRLDSLESRAVVLFRSACMDRTKGEQQWAGMLCPDSLYHGVVTR